MLRIKFTGTFRGIALRRMPRDTLVWIMAWCRQATSPYLSQFWPWRMSRYGVSRPQWIHDDVIKWKQFPRYWPFVRRIHRSPVNSPHKGQWRGALKFPLICARINGWVNNREAGDLRRHQAHCDVIVMLKQCLQKHEYLFVYGLLHITIAHICNTTHKIYSLS